MNQQQVIEVRHGSYRFYIFPYEECCVSQPIAAGSFEAWELQVLKSFLRPGDRVLDIGAHIGYHSLAFAEILGADGRVIAIEPNPRNRTLLYENIKINGLNVQVLPFAGSDHAGFIDLYLCNGNTGDTRTWADQTHPYKIQAMCVRLDDVLNIYDQYSVIKIDTQGAEVKVLKGMQALLTNQKRIRMIIEFWPYGLKGAGSTVEELDELVKDFQLIELDEEKRQLRCIKRLSDIVLPSYMHFTNVLCVKGF